MSPRPPAARGAGPNRLAWRAFETAFRPWMRRHVHEVLVTGLPRDLPADAPVLLCPNHVSWWDGFLVREVHRRLRPRHGFHTLMLERELRGRPWLRALGGLGLVPGSLSSLRESVRRVQALAAADPGLVLTIYPQGVITAVDRRPLAFRGGVRLFRRALSGAPVLPVALRLEHLDRHRPTALVSVGRPLAPRVPDEGFVQRLERRVERELDAVSAFLHAHGEETTERWPAPHERLPRPARPRRPGAPASIPRAPWLSLN